MIVILGIIFGLLNIVILILLILLIYKIKDRNVAYRITSAEWWLVNPVCSLFVMCFLSYYDLVITKLEEINVLEIESFGKALLLIAIHEGIIFIVINQVIIYFYKRFIKLYNINRFEWFDESVVQIFIGIQLLAMACLYWRLSKLDNGKYDYYGVEIAIRDFVLLVPIFVDNLKKMLQGICRLKRFESNNVTLKKVGYWLNFTLSATIIPVLLLITSRVSGSLMNEIIAIIYILIFIDAGIFALVFIYWFSKWYLRYNIKQCLNGRKHDITGFYVNTRYKLVKEGNIFKLHTVMNEFKNDLTFSTRLQYMISSYNNNLEKDKLFDEKVTLDEVYETILKTARKRNGMFNSAYEMSKDDYEVKKILGFNTEVN